jgi:hypothetical protein
MSTETGTIPSDDLVLSLGDAPKRESEGFAPIPDGIYAGNIFGTPDVVAPKNGSGNYYLNLQVRVSDGQQYANRRLWEKLFIGKDSWWKVIEVLKVVAPDVDTEKDISLGELRTALAGKAVKVAVGTRSWQDQKQPTNEDGQPNMRSDNYIAEFLPVSAEATGPQSDKSLF